MAYTMLNIVKIDTIDALHSLKAEYFAQTHAPLDGMWHFGFVPMSQHYAFYENDVLVGFCCVNSDGYLLQYFLSPQASTSASDLFTLIAQQDSKVIGDVSGAFVSTCDPSFLSLSLDNAASSSVNTLLYCGVKQGVNEEAGIDLTLATDDHLSLYVDFAAQAIGAPKEWLTGYYGNLIARQELFGYWQDGELVATGERRKFDEFQTQYADLGMIVSAQHRGQGIATKVIKALIANAVAEQLIPMCSTEKTNIGAQRAIEKAGLVSKHRLLQVQFETL